MIEKLIKYLVDFAMKQGYSISIPKDIDNEIEEIVISFKKKDIKIN